MTSSTCLGIDIGGSKIAAGIVDADGRVLERDQVPTPAREGGGAIIAATAALARRLITDRPVAGIGIGSAGIVEQGRVTAATELLTDWAGTDVVAELGARLDRAELPIVAVNDVHAHGAGEAWCGAGAGADTVLSIAIGTGLGGALVQGGVPMVGAHGAAGHLGHVPSPDAGDLPCSCGRPGHLEAIASGYGLVQLYRSLGGDVMINGGRQVTERLDHDSTAATAVRRSGTALGRAIGGMINILDPDVVVLSGSLTRSGSTWWSAVRDSARETVLPTLIDLSILPGTLGDDAAVIGAARLAMTAEAR